MLKFDVQIFKAGEDTFLCIKSENGDVLQMPSYVQPW